MPDDPGRVGDTIEWMARASGDLRAARHVLAAEPPLLEDAMFHCQQSAEKAFKAFLVWHDQPFRKTHSIEEVGELCLALDETLKPHVDRAAPLTEFAWKFRYPGVAEEPSIEEARAALTTATDVYDAVLARLPDEARPPAIGE